MDNNPTSSDIEHSFENPITHEKNANWMKIMIGVTGGLVLLIFGIVLGAGYFQQSDSPKQESKIPLEVIQPTITIPLNPTAAITSKPPLQAQPTTSTYLEGTKECIHKNLNVSMQVPQSWTCDSSDEWWMNVTSDVFDINISTLGRGEYCFEVPVRSTIPAEFRCEEDGEFGILRGDDCMTHSEADCQTEDFFTNKYVSMRLYRSGGSNREFFGGFLTDDLLISSDPWVSVKYNDMENRELKYSEAEEIRTFLDSLRKIN